MKQEVNLLDRIDTVKVNSVSDEAFEATWGVSMQEHLQEVMAFVKAFDEKLEKL